MGSEPEYFQLSMFIPVLLLDSQIVEKLSISLARIFPAMTLLGNSLSKEIIVVAFFFF